MPKPPPTSNAEDLAEAERILQLQKTLELRLMPRFLRSVHAVLDDQNTCAAMHALLGVSGQLLLAMLDRAPTVTRQAFLRRFRQELKTTLANPHPLSGADFFDSTFGEFFDFTFILRETK